MGVDERGGLTMRLQEFNDAQVAKVRERAKKLRTYRQLTGADAAKMEQLARRELEVIKELKGVSLDELLNEVDFPGSFSNT